MYRKMYLDVNVLSFYIREYGHQKLFIAEYMHATLGFHGMAELLSHVY